MDEKILKDKSLLIILAYAPVGFGHLRVSDALYHGLPNGVTPVLLGAQDKSVTAFYRFISIHPITRMIMEIVQTGWWENIFTYFYKDYLQTHTKVLQQQFITLLQERLEIPKTVLVVASHYGLAHQLGKIKKELEKKIGIRIVLVVQVTDDSPQQMWYVETADLIFVPSEFTKDKLSEYAKSAKLNLAKIIVNPYPVNPFLSEKLSPARFENRLSQLNPQVSNKIHMMIPISGAAVGMSYISQIVKDLSNKKPEFIFDIVIKSAPYTKDFLNSVASFPNVSVHVSTHDRGVVDMYKDAYKEQDFALEITKPSEQAFKVLLSPKEVGGTALLFTQPVGRQEYENLNFLKRHHLIPSKEEKFELWNLAEKNHDLSATLLERAHNWRGLRLPQEKDKAGQFIIWCFKQKIFQRMMHFSYLPKTPEIGEDGVHRFWDKVIDYLENSS
jgi:hypothetical protein